MSRRRKSNDTLPFDTIKLEGSLFVPELLERAARGEASFQKESDYAIPKGLKLHDEYGRAFRIATASWQEFVPQICRTDLDPAAVTRSFVIDLLCQCLGYTDLAVQEQTILHGDRGFPIAALALDGRLPVIIAPHTLDLDVPDPRFAIVGSGAKKKSAHQLAQEFLNASKECLWAIVTNGKSIRLLRDADTLTRPNYLEFDLETILCDDQQRYADFSSLWRILHASRGTKDPSIWDGWKSEGHAQGLRVREGLRVGVTQALVTLGCGFLQPLQNTALRQRLQNGSLTPYDYFQQLLRLIYRFIVLTTLEERGLLHAHLPGPESDPARKAYAAGYSLRRLRSRAMRRSARDQHSDLWLSLAVVFRGLARGEARLALPGLGGLFAETQCPDLDSALLPNSALLDAQFGLRWSRASGSLAAIDYRNMGTEELGSVYESLLELVPTVQLEPRRFSFLGMEGDTTSTAGNARKTTGSHYTPDPLVQELVKSVLDPLITATVAANPQEPVAALLSLTLCDPACGSGHFLLSAARRLAEKIAELRHPEGYGDAEYRHALREVISRCIHGVDRNPMAIELARTALWLEGFDPGKPLSFLDHHLVYGDALLGIDRFSQLEKGIPDTAFRPLSGDDAALCKDLAKLNKAGKRDLDAHHQGQAALFAPDDQAADAFAELARLEALPEDSPDEVEAKAAAYQSFLQHARDSHLARAADCYLAAFLTPKSILASQQFSLSAYPTTRSLLAEISQPAPAERESHAATVAAASETCRQSFVLHWPLAFPHVFARGGFDCILGNPPWEVSQLGEEEFFASRSPRIAKLAGAARKKAIAALEAEEPVLWREYQETKRTYEATNTFYRESGRFDLTAVGKLNTYPLFAEAITRMTAPNGRAGFIVPTGIATDDSTKAFFGSLATSGRLASLFDFENSAPLFQGVHRSFKFCLLTLGPVTESSFAFFLTSTDHLSDEPRRFTLTPEDFLLINPNTRTCPVFRSRADAELTRAIYRRVPVLIREKSDTELELNPWGVRFMQGLFNMTSASGLFETQPSDGLLPLYEAKMIHQFDHRWAGYGFGSGEDDSSGGLTLDQKQDPRVAAQPRYWVAREHVDRRLLDNSHPLYPLFLARLDQRLDELAKWFRFWLWGYELAEQNDENASFLRREILETTALGDSGMATMISELFEPEHAKRMAARHPLTREERADLWQQIRADGGLLTKDARKVGAKDCAELSPVWLDLAESILPPRDRQWQMGWRDICRATDERTVIASVIPRTGVGHTLPLFVHDKPAYLAVALLGCVNSLVLDFVARQKVGGTHLTYGYLKQLPILSPEAYAEADLAFIVPRVLELTYTAHDLRPWAEDVISSYRRQFPQDPLTVPECTAPFPFDPDRRAVLRAELDARYARLYGLTRNELRYILDPADTHGLDYPTETFRVLKNNDLKNHGEYRTQRLVLEAWDRLAAEENTWELPKTPRVPLPQSYQYVVSFMTEILIQSGDTISWQQLSNATDLLKDRAVLAAQAKPLVGAVADSWLALAGDQFDATQRFDQLSGLCTRGRMEVIQADDELVVRLLTREGHPDLPHVRFDARLALAVTREQELNRPTPSDQQEQSKVASLARK